MRLDVGDPDSSQWNHRIPALLPAAACSGLIRYAERAPAPRLMSSTTTEETVAVELVVAVAVIAVVEVGWKIGAVVGTIVLEGSPEQAPNAANAMTDTTTLPPVII